MSAGFCLSNQKLERGSEQVMAYQPGRRCQIYSPVSNGFKFESITLGQQRGSVLRIRLKRTPATNDHWQAAQRLLR